MTDMISFFMTLGTILAALATLPQIVAVWRDRSILSGYNHLACATLCIAMISFAIAFTMMEYWVSVLCEIPVATFWGMSSILSYKRSRIMAAEL